jgi:hypothetical protein
LMDSRGDKKNDAGSAFRRFEAVMRKLVRVPKKEVDEKIAAERRRQFGPPVMLLTMRDRSGILRAWNVRIHMLWRWGAGAAKRAVPLGLQN